jgi:ribosomal protein S24E
MIKINIAVLNGELDIEFKKNADAYFFIVIMSKSAYFKENGKIWHGKITAETQIQELIYLIKIAHQNPSTPQKITINDGLIAKINLKEENSAIQLQLTNIEFGNIECALIQKIFAFINDLTQDETLKKYTKAFEIFN